MAEQNMHRVFVYGTLKSGGEIRGLDSFNGIQTYQVPRDTEQPEFDAPGFDNYDIEEAEFIANIVGKAKTKHPDFTMIDLGSFPGVIKITTDGEPHAFIQGEVWEVNDEVLDQLDAIEGHPDFYERFKTETTQGIAWMYVLPESYIKMYKGIADTDSQVELQDNTYIWHTQK